MSGGGFRVLFMTADEFPPFRPDAEVLFGKELVNRGYRVDWIMRARRPDQPAGRVPWRGGHAWVSATNFGLRRIDRLRKHLSSLRNDFRVFSLTATGDYDFVQVKDKFYGAIMGLAAARRRGIPCFFWLSFPFPEHSLELVKDPRSRYPVFYWLRGHFFKFLLYRVICPLADHVFVQSEEMKRVMSENGVHPDKMTPVPMGVDFDLISVADRDPPPSQRDGEPIVLYLGSLDRARRLEFLLEAFAKAAETHPTAKLYFVGEGTDPADQQILEDVSKRLGIERRVVFTGFLPRPEALRLVRAATVCVSLTTTDAALGVASSTKLVEYLALRKPVVANWHPDQRQVLEESGGGLCLPWDVQQFAEGLRWLLDHPEEARAMAEKGREYVRRTRDYQVIAARLDADYSRLVQRHDLAPQTAPR